MMLLTLLLLLTLSAYYLGLRRAVSVAGGPEAVRSLHSRPPYYGAIDGHLVWFARAADLCCLADTGRPCHYAPGRGPITIGDAGALAGAPEPDRQRHSQRHQRQHRRGPDQPGRSGGRGSLPSAAKHQSRALAVVAAAAALAGLALVRSRIRTGLRARNHVERLVLWLLAACSTIAIFTTIGIVLSVLYEALRFFKSVPLTEFLFGLQWSPQMAIRSDQVGSSGAFGAVPVLAGTLLISGIAMAVAVPIGLMSAIYMSEYAGKRFRAVAKPLMEILAGIPTVVYGFFAALVVAPFIRAAGQTIGLDVSSESALAAGLVMGIMIIPFVSSLSDDMINAVPQALRDGAYGLGATQSETIKQVVLPAALPGIVGGVLLAVSRAIGETMIVVMAAGLDGQPDPQPA